VQVFGRLNDNGNPSREQQASEKRQGTKSRAFGSLRCSSGYEELVAGTVAEIGDVSLHAGISSIIR
jgi:hypothetical protein